MKLGIFEVRTFCHIYSIENACVEPALLRKRWQEPSASKLSIFERFRYYASPEFSLDRIFDLLQQLLHVIARQTMRHFAFINICSYAFPRRIMGQYILTVMCFLD